MSTNVKQAMTDLVEQLPDDCSWDEVMYRVYVRQKIEAGLDDVENGRVVSHEDIFAEFEEHAP